MTDAPKFKDLKAPAEGERISFKDAGLNVAGDAYVYEAFADALSQELAPALRASA